MRPSRSLCHPAKRGEEGEQQSDGGLKRKGKTRIKEARSIARTLLCVSGVPFDARPRCTSTATALQPLPAALSHHNGLPSMPPQRMDQPGGDLSWKMRREGEGRLNWVVCGWECPCPISTNKTIHSPCPPSFTPFGGNSLLLTG